MFKKLLALLVFSIFGLVFFVQPSSIWADDDPTDLGELLSESEDDGESTSQSNSSSDGSGSEFDTSEYRKYNTRGYEDFEDKFYVTPLKNVTSSSPEIMYDKIREELAKTGYEAYCMVENVRIAPSYNTDKLIKKYLYYTPGGLTKVTSSKEMLGTDNAEYPIWRDLDDKQFLMTSLEEYFGFKDVYEEDPALSEINTAPINSLLSQEQACVQGWESLAAQRRACNRLEDKKTCALTKRKIPNSGFEVHDLMGAAAGFYSRQTGSEGWAKIAKDPSDYGTDIKCATACKGTCNGSICEERPSVIGCSILFSNPDDRAIKPNYEEELLKKYIINAPYYHDKAYRIGFIVAAIETRVPNKPCEGCNEATTIFNFFTPKTEQSQRDEVLVAAFKLPDIGTNKGPSSNYGHEEWDDPLDLTRMALTTKENQEAHDVAKMKKRGSILSRAEDAANQTSASRIKCSAGLFGDPATETCEVPLPRALTDMINGNVTNESCENNTETVNFISDLAGLRYPTKDPIDNYGKIFTEKNGGQVLLNLFFGSLYNAEGETPGYADVNFKSIFTINEDTYLPKPDVPETLVHFYLVYPMGFELETVEEAIKGTFFSTEQIAIMNEDSSIVNVFEMTGQTQNLNGGGIDWTYEDFEETAQEKCGVLRDKKTGVKIGPMPCIKEPSINIKQYGGKVDILGGKLSWWLRKVQTSLSSTLSFAHSYYESCKTMEEFLLGRCAGNSYGGGNVDNPPEAFSICEVAENYNIDCDFFKAIYAVETCSGTVMNHEPSGSYNCCNGSGFCGPMQVLSDVVRAPALESIMAGDDLDLCMEEDTGMDNFILAARWMLWSRWCTYNSVICNGMDADIVFDWDEKYIETQGNSNITTKTEIQGFIEGWYGSATLIIDRENWPEGSTYTDAVMALMGIGDVNSSGEWDTWMSSCKYPD